MQHKVDELRTLITENLRVQRHSESVEYVDASNLINDLKARQNHVVFARRGCGKTLLLFKSSKRTSDDIRTIYLNCEDFKRHSFPDVLLEILESVFDELQQNLTGWFGRKRKLKEIIKEISSDITNIQNKPDESEAEVREVTEVGQSDQGRLDFGVSDPAVKLGLSKSTSSTASARVEKAFREHKSKLKDLGSGPIDFCLAA